MSMPQGGESGQSRETGPQTDTPGQQRRSDRPGQSAVPGQSGTAGQGGIPNQAGPPPGQQWAGEQQAQYGVPPQGGASGEYQGGPMAGRPISPVNEIETRVTGRRFVQYIIDIIIYGIVAGLISWALGDRGTGAVHAVLVVVDVVVVVAWYLIYWAYVPFRRGGQTLGMTVLGIRVISANGGPASFVQLAVRSILLILFGVFSVIVGFIVMMCSRYRQRTGDHMAHTMVVRARVEPMPAQQMYAGAGQAGPM
ncbi:MAG TPA: RDD family protein [Streptosporangiaceae bacterium]|nr:RDD family protein [Streptosporangiaceae bacterium]